MLPFFFLGIRVSKHISSHNYKLTIFPLPIFVFEKVAEGATALYMEQLRGIQYITDRGAQQLSVDIEYLSNVLSALSMPIPPCLATFQTCFSTPKDQLKDLIKSDSGNQLDLPTANLVCKMRRISLE